MDEFVYLGREHDLQKVPQAMWKQHVTHIPDHENSRLSFMTESYHQVRNFVVVELAKSGRPVLPELISTTLQLSINQVNLILDELEQKLFFLVRNEQGAVSWAYPVTVETTPHRLTFNSGERLYAA
jgi:hypothetical protein